MTATRATAEGAFGETEIGDACTVRAPHPMLENGAVMPREEFHRFYSNCESAERVELIEGVVYLPSPTKLLGHANEQGLVLDWLSAYANEHDDVKHAPPSSILLDDGNEPEPDAMLYRLKPDRFQDGYLLGAPELIVEICNTSYARDLHQKRAAYERNGVKDYIVWRTEDAAIDWFELREGAYVRRQPGEGGIIESREFPGLRLDVPAMLRHDRRAVLAALTA
jgi:Uma2 family endonuclease